MANFFYRILNFFFGPSDAATARHFTEQAKQRTEPFTYDSFSAQYGSKTAISGEDNSIDLHKAIADAQWTVSTGLKDYEAFQPSKPKKPQYTPEAGVPFSIDLSNPHAVFAPAKPQPIPSPATSKKQAILNYIKLRSPKGVTAESVGRAFPAWRYSTITARISELYKSGLIVAVGAANTSVGSQASLYAVAE